MKVSNPLERLAQGHIYGALSKNRNRIEWFGSLIDEL